MPAEILGKAPRCHTVQLSDDGVVGKANGMVLRSSIAAARETRILIRISRKVGRYQTTFGAASIQRQYISRACVAKRPICMSRPL